MFPRLRSISCRFLLILTFALATALLLVFSIVAPKKHTEGPIGCYHIKDASLVDISDTNPIKGKSIFFLETSCNSYKNGKIIISSRQACSVESAAKMNPNLDVYLLYSSPGVIKYENTASDNFLKALSTYNNVKIYHLDYERYTRDTPVQELYESGKVELSQYPIHHASDVLRFLTLWKYGGIYFDLDVIVLQPLEGLMENCAGAELDLGLWKIGNGILNFAPTGEGHRLVEMCLEDVNNDFQGNIWAHNGGGALTRVLIRMCGPKNVTEMLRSNCSGFTILPPKAFFPIHYSDWKIYFDPKYNKEIFNLVNGSYVTHIWNDISEYTKIDVNSDVPYSILAKKYCPRVFAERREFF